MWPWNRLVSEESDSRDVMTATLNAQLESIADRLEKTTAGLIDRIEELKNVSQEVTDIRDLVAEKGEKGNGK